MIDLLGVTRRFRGCVAVRDVTLSIGPGITGLLGPNGAGKTTLLRMVATVLAPDEGRVLVDGLDLARADERVVARRRLGYVPQDASLHGGFTAFDAVDHLAILKELGPRRARHDEVRRVLALAGLEADAGRKVRQLSGGLRSRLMLAQALLGNPPLLVLDEPTAGLDPEQRLRFRELLGRLPAGTTVLLATHQTEDVAALCQRVIVLDHAAVRFDGSPQRLASFAAGRVWRSSSRDAGAELAWVGPDGLVRNVGDAPDGADLVTPTIEDGYLLLVAGASTPR